MPKFRFTVRRMMAIVAIVGLLFGIGREAVRFARHWKRCREFVTTHDRRRREALYFADQWVNGRFRLANREFAGKSREWMVERELKRAAHHEEMKQRFKRASFRPWEPIPRDKPYFIVDDVRYRDRPPDRLADPEDYEIRTDQAATTKPAALAR